MCFFALPKQSKFDLIIHGNNAKQQINEVYHDYHYQQDQCRQDR